MGFGGAAGRLVELGERKRRAQFEAARALLFRDGDSGRKASSAGAGLAGSRFSRISPRSAMQFRLEGAIADSLDRQPALRRGSPTRGRVARPASASASSDLQEPVEIMTF